MLHFVIITVPLCCLTCCLAVHVSHQDSPGCLFLTPTAKQNAELRGTVGSGEDTPPMAAAVLLGCGCPHWPFRGKLTQKVL